MFYAFFVVNLPMHAYAIRFDEPVPYAQAERLQEALVAARIAEEIPDTLLVLEHRPVVTLGRRARDGFLKVSPEHLAERGIDYAVAARGGDVTYHGPGQLVLYPILKLDARVAGAHGFLSALEDIVIGTAGSFGVEAFRREGKSGAWTEQGKIAAIGFRLRRWVSFHGLSLNVAADLPGFDLIVPCGLVGEPVSSLEAILGANCPRIDAVAMALIEEAGRVFGLSLVTARPGDDFTLPALARILKTASLP